MDDLTQKSCQPCEGWVLPLSKADALSLLENVAGWALNDAGTELFRHFSFKNYYRTMAFVNAVAFIAHKENHHPDLKIGYNHCVITYTTHAIKGLSENDFICAAKVNQFL